MGTLHREGHPDFDWRKSAEILLRQEPEEEEDEDDDEEEDDDDEDAGETDDGYSE